MFPFMDHIASVVIVEVEEEVFLSIRYVPSKDLSVEDLKYWLTYNTAETLKQADVGFIEYGSVGSDGSKS